MKCAVFGSRWAVLVLAAVLCVAVTPHAEARSQAAIVMDMRNGKVLYARSADVQRHPASLTKMMTLYLTFEAVRDGRLRLDQKLRVSRHAARQPASKLYLRAGQRVSVRSLIRATALKSANDAAMVLAEAIGGSQAGFARMMTRKAGALAMRNSRFRNPHGLTQAGHYSTARDMAILARHLYFDFPKYWNIFSRRTDHAAGKRIWNTNRLLAVYRGADGLKTGYTRAAGYNLAATAVRGRKRIVAVQMGASSSADRTRKVTRLLDMGFARAQSRVRTVRPTGARREPLLVLNSPEPRDKPIQTATGVAAVSAVLAPQPAQAALPPTTPDQAAAPVAETVISASRLAPVEAKLPPASPRAVGTVPVRASTPAHDVPEPPIRPVRVAKSGQLSWAAEIGPFDSESDALVQLAGLPETVNAVVSKSPAPGLGSVFTIRLPRPNETQAAAVCAVEIKRPATCRVMPTGAER
ncbi:MAG: serine hydrolase [Pseudomonadota bacterium]